MAGYAAVSLTWTTTDRAARAQRVKAPVVLSARWPKATWTSQETADAWGLGFDVTIEVDEFAPISSTSATIYDSTGASRGGMYGASTT